MLAHQRLEHAVDREQTKSFAETGATAEMGETIVVGERSRFELVNAEETGQLGMLAIKNRAGAAHRVLPPCERIDRHRMVVACDRLRVVTNLQAECVETECELD